MSVVPARIVHEMFDVHLLPEGESVFVETVMLAAGEIPHQFPEPFLIHFPGRPDAGNPFKGVPVFLVGQGEFLFGDMDDGQFFLIQHWRFLSVWLPSFVGAISNALSHIIRSLSISFVVVSLNNILILYNKY